VAAQPGWRFSLVVVDPAENKDGDQVTTIEARPMLLDAVRDRIERAGRLLDQGMVDAAYLLLWSAVEAELRHVASAAHLPVTSTPTTMMLRELFSAGELSREQFETALNALPLRHSVAHGVELSSLDEKQARALERLAQTLLEELSSAENAAQSNG
jgi:hypothetical protein